jgi:hypothetical protein
MDASILLVREPGRLDRTKGTKNGVPTLAVAYSMLSGNESAELHFHSLGTWTIAIAVR